MLQTAWTGNIRVKLVGPVLDTCRQYRHTLSSIKRRHAKGVAELGSRVTALMIAAGGTDVQAYSNENSCLCDTVKSLSSIYRDHHHGSL